MHIIMNPTIVNGNSVRPARTISDVINAGVIATAFTTSDVKFLEKLSKFGTFY